MELFPLFSAVLVLAAVFAWVNYRYLKLPTTIGVMVMALGASTVVVLLRAVGVVPAEPIADFLGQLEFGSAVLDVWLAFLLFAGALHVDFGRLLGSAKVIGILATLGVVFTMLMVGALIHLVAGFCGVELSFIEAAVFGALIAPTDPIAVLGILRTAGAPKDLEIKITGESLFNDGVGVVLFTVVLAVAGAGGIHAPHGALEISKFFAWEVFGALGLGLLCGYLTYLLMRVVEDAHLEVLLTFALACGLFSLCGALHTSGPLAVVAAGLFIGNSGRALAMGEEVRRRVDEFWELVDEILNVLLFVLIGLEVLVLDLSGPAIALGFLAIPLVLASRFVGTKLLLSMLGRSLNLPA
ncbi:MAG: CPA1 family monovalent cation:H+ antiporter, partial [Planctomycetota bacterium]